MWYEILPPVVIMVGCFYLPSLANAYLHKLTTGNYYFREIGDNADYTFFMRDLLLTGGKPWIRKGLENIPDEE